MRILSAVVSIVLATVVWMPFAGGTAYAESPPPDVTASAEPNAEDAILEHQLACEDGVCSLRVDLGPDAPGWLPAAGFALTVLEDNLQMFPGGAGFSVSDELSLEMPVGNLKLADAQINLVTGEDGSVDSFYGSAEIPLPSIGMVGQAASKGPIAASIGFDRASALPDVDVNLDPDRKYLFLDFAAGTELAAAVDDGTDSTLWLSIPEGQRAAIIIDPQDRYVFIDGNVTVRYSGNLAFLTQLLDPTETVDLWSGELPLRHQATVHVSGVVADELADTRLELGGRYAVDGGKAAEWLKLDGEPLVIEGGVVISEEGLLGTGIVRSSVLPNRILESAAQAQVFVPFSSDYRKAYVALNAQLEVPFAGLAVVGYARVDGALDVIADASLQAPWRSEESDVIVEADSGTADEIALDHGRWAGAWETASGGVRAGLAYVKEPAQSGYGWLTDKASSGYEVAAGGVEWSVDLASRQWCTTRGLCQDDGATETAMR